MAPPAASSDSSSTAAADSQPLATTTVTPQSTTEPAVQAASVTPGANQDPRYARFFRMVQVGVPPQAVKLKMKAEGLDPNILE